MTRHTILLAAALALLAAGCGRKTPSTDPGSTPAQTPAQPPAPTPPQPPTPTATPGPTKARPPLSALYRFRDEKVVEHVYTYGDGEPAAWRKNPAFKDEAVVAYVATAPQPDAARLYRSYCRDARHYFTLAKPAAARDVVRVEAFEVYVWTAPGDGRVPVHASFGPDDKDAYFSADLAAVRGYRGNGQRRVVEAMFYAYPGAAGPAPTGTDPAPKSGSDADLIQGTWKFEWSEFQGKKEAASGDDVIIFAGTKMILRAEGRSSPGSFQLDQTKTPKAIEIGRSEDNPKDVAPGIYELDGDSLKICFARGTDAKRPAAFQTQPGSESLVWSLKRDRNAPAYKEPDVSGFPTAIVGKWKSVSGVTAFPLFRDTEFTRDGRVLQYDTLKKKMVERYKYRFEKGVLVLTLTDKDSKGLPEERVRVQSITGDELVAASPSGKLKRVLEVETPTRVGVAEAAKQLTGLGVKLTTDDKQPGGPVVAVDFSTSMYPATSKQMALVSEFTNLQALSVPSSYVTSEGLALLKDLKKLHTIDLSGTQTRDAGVAGLKTLAGLQRLSLRETFLNDAGLKELKELPGLQHLDLSKTRVTDAGMKEVKEFKGLQSLTLTDTAVTDAGLKELAQSKTLQTLGLSSNRVTDAGVKELKELGTLQGLDVSLTSVTDAALTDLKEVKGLQHLDLSQTKVTDAGLKELKGLGQLMTLRLGTTRVTDAGVKELKGLKGLLVLDLFSTGVTDAALKDLKELRGLQALGLASTGVTDAGIRELSGMKFLKSLNLEQTRVTAAGVQALARTLPEGGNIRFTRR
jgi:internalin A